MKTTKKLAAALLALVMLLSMAACGNNTDANPDGSEGGNADASGEKVINIAQPVEMDTLDIGNMGDGYTVSMATGLMEPLFRQDENGTPQPATCESYTVSEDGLTYTFTLRETYWSNGDPVTAQDFVYSWQRTNDPANAFENSFLFTYIPIVNLDEVQAGELPVTEMGISAPDEKTFVVELETPCNWLVEYLAAPYFGPLNQEFVESCGDQYALSSETLLTNGAFELNDWTAGDLTWELTKDEDYWAASDVKLNKITYQVIKDTQTGIMSYESGTVDYTVIDSDQVAMYSGSEDFYSAETTYSWYVVPNFDVPELQNQNLRWAIGFAIDRDALVNNILKDGSIAKTDCNYSQVFFDAEGNEFNSVREDFWGYDPDRAAECWNLAKQELGVDSLDLDMLVEDTESAQRVAAFLQSEIETNCPGLTINLRIVPKTQRIEQMESGDFELSLHRTGSSVPNVVAKLGQYSGGHNLNYGNYYDEAYDELYYAALNETDVEAQWEMLLDLELMAQESGVAIPIYRTADCLLIRPNITGYVHNLIGVGWDFTRADVG